MKVCKSIRMLWLLVMMMVVLLVQSNDAAAVEPVYWKGTVLSPGQIGLVTVQKPINIWERKGDKLKLVKVAKKGESYKVFQYDSKFGGQFELSGSTYLTNIKGYFKYETPSKSILAKANAVQEPINAIVKKITDLRDTPPQREVTRIQTRLSSIPQRVLEKMDTAGIKVIITDKPITSLAEFASLRGVVPRGWENTHKTWDDVPGIGGSKRIGVRAGYSDFGQGHGSINLELHETSHSLDYYVFSKASASSDFMSLWKKEAKSLFANNDYFLTYPEEFFAECYAYYYYSAGTREKLKQNAPFTYSYISKLQ